MKDIFIVWHAIKKDVYKRQGRFKENKGGTYPMVYRIYVEKKPGFDVEANGLKNELTSLLGIKAVSYTHLCMRCSTAGRRAAVLPSTMTA